ncbi:hypothetical protein PAPYR_840 [Paratrimastix pyriformis]|uniref:Uncharacterized protein n=1 Tax=Paratrimastix pyriformis TaxID=342808 RepID=A0ABQ8UYF5_9EUKA|nr:hypothetical protein PAPYR_840 [Paratrimastix pyriformis]
MQFPKPETPCEKQCETSSLLCLSPCRTAFDALYTPCADLCEQQFEECLTILNARRPEARQRACERKRAECLTACGPPPTSESANRGNALMPTDQTSETLAAPVPSAARLLSESDCVGRCTEEAHDCLAGCSNIDYNCLTLCRKKHAQCISDCNGAAGTPSKKRRQEPPDQQGGRRQPAASTAYVAPHAPLPTSLGGATSRQKVGAIVEEGTSTGKRFLPLLADEEGIDAPPPPPSEADLRADCEARCQAEKAECVSQCDLELIRNSKNKSRRLSLPARLQQKECIGWCQGNQTLCTERCIAQKTVERNRLVQARDAALRQQLESRCHDRCDSDQWLAQCQAVCDQRFEQTMSMLEARPFSQREKQSAQAVLGQCREVLCPTTLRQSCHDKCTSLPADEETACRPLCALFLPDLPPRATRDLMELLIGKGNVQLNPLEATSEQLRPDATSALTCKDQLRVCNSECNKSYSKCLADASAVSADRHSRCLKERHTASQGCVDLYRTCSHPGRAAAQ